MFSHYGPDYQKICEEINAIFDYEEMTIKRCKYYVIRNGLSNDSRSPLKEEEA